MNNKFPILGFISTMLTFFGWLVVVAGFLYAIYEGMIEPNRPGHSFNNGDFLDLALGSFLFLLGLFSAALGEIIGVLFAIELNTRS